MFILALLTTFTMAHADAGSMPWATLNKNVTCGGIVDTKESLDFKSVGDAQVLKAESKDGRLLIFADLHRPGQVRWLVNEALSDEDYDRREALLKSIAPSDADFIRSLTQTRQAQIYSGMFDHYVNLDFSTKTRALSLSCAEANLFRTE
jgi:hypothetical protein